MVVHGPYPVGEPRVAREAHAARRAGFTVDVVCMREEGEVGKEVVDGVTVHRLPLTHRRGGGGPALAAEYLGFTLAAAAQVGRLHWKHRYSVVQIHNPPDFLVLASLLPRLLGARTVLDVHDLAPEMFSMRFGDRRFAGTADWVLRAVERAAIGLAHEVLTVHEPYARELVRRGAPRERVTVVMNSFDEDLLPPPAVDPADPRDRVVYHGTVTPPYGVATLVEAFALVHEARPETQLAIYGAGDALRDACDRAEALGIGDALDAPGVYLPHADVLRAVQGAAVGVIPNLETPISRFALSTKLFEYVALGIPVVCSNLPTLREHFDDHEVLFVEPGDVEGLAAAIRASIEEPEASAARAAAARARYERDYRWSVSADRYVQLLRRQLKRRR